METKTLALIGAILSVLTVGVAAQIGTTLAIDQSGALVVEDSTCNEDEIFTCNMNCQLQKQEPMSSCRVLNDEKGKTTVDCECGPRPMPGDSAPGGDSPYCRGLPNCGTA